MRILRRFFIRLSNLALGRRADQRLQDEIAEHLAFQTEENLRAGMSPAEARRQAALKLGAAGAIREQYHSEVSLPFIGTSSCCKIRQPYKKTSQEFHTRSSALTLKKRAMMAAVCSHSRVSACSCLRPVTVRR